MNWIPEMPDGSYIALAIESARHSPCQSKRGVVIWDSYGVVSTGYNDQPSPFVCDGSDACKRTCGKTAVHAEQSALLSAGNSRLEGAEMLHIKVDIDGNPVASGGPSCLQCSKLILVARMKGMWLLHEKGWTFYMADRFHYQSGTGSDYMVVGK